MVQFKPQQMYCVHCLLFDEEMRPADLILQEKETGMLIPLCASCAAANELDRQMDGTTAQFFDDWSLN